MTLADPKIKARCFGATEKGAQNYDRVRRAEQDTSRTGYVDVGDLNIYYEEQGEGSPLVLIHGGLATGDMWRACAGSGAALPRARTGLARSRPHQQPGGEAGLRPDGR